MKKNLISRKFSICKWKLILLQCLKMSDMNDLFFPLLSLIDPDILKQSKFTDHEINIIES